MKPLCLCDRTCRNVKSAFDIRQQCFIWGKIRIKGHEKLTKVAIERQDEVVRLRMLAYRDLFAYDAKYHRACLGHYISKRNTQAQQRKSNETECDLPEYEKAFSFIVNDIENTIFSKNKAANIPPVTGPRT